MWFLNPGRDALYAVLSRVLAPYVSNLDMTKFEAGLWAGHFSVNNLRLKKSALDKFRLPIDVIEGHLGHLTLNIPWANLSSKPAEVIIEDLYVLAIPASEAKVDLAEDDARDQAAKQERLVNSEVLHSSGTEFSPEEDERSHGVFESLINRIVNNLQITVRNIHIRYEDSLSVPGRPFAVGVTLAEFSAISTDDTWEPAFVQNISEPIRKLSILNSLSIYFNTDSQSITTKKGDEVLRSLREQISNDIKPPPGHQFILKPVTGQGRVIMNKGGAPKKAKVEAEVFFDEIGFVLDDSQYRDAISMIDMYHFYLRRYRYKRFRPSDEEIRYNPKLALFRFAARAILDEVHQKRRSWTWEHFKERRDDRGQYIPLFMKREFSGSLSPEETSAFEALERKLRYEDIRFYRSIARSRLRKERASRKANAEKQKTQSQQQQGWIAWAWNGTRYAAGLSANSSEEPGPDGMTDSQRKELYEAINYDEKEVIASGFEPSRDIMKLSLSAQLRTGSLALRSGFPNAKHDIISLVFDGFCADIVQRPDNLEAALTLDGMHINDGTTPGTLYPDVIRMKDSLGSKSGSFNGLNRLESARAGEGSDAKQDSSPFFSLKFENNPLDERAENAITIKMKAMEVIYHRGVLEAVFSFFRPPESQLESVNALLDAANETIEGLRNQTRAGLEYALQTHKTIDMKVDMSAPIIIIPEDVCARKCRHLVVDVGHIAVESDLADKAALREIQAKRNQQYTDEDFRRLESMMYDKFLLSLTSTQVVIGPDLELCLAALAEHKNGELHLLERIDIRFNVQMSIVAEAANLTRFKASGKLPSLAVNISNSKYQALMRIIDVAIPHFGENQQPSTRDSQREQLVVDRGVSTKFFDTGAGPEYVVEDPTTSTGAFEQRSASPHDPSNQRIFELQFEVERLQASLYKTSPDETENLLAEASLNFFTLRFVLSTYDMKADISLRALGLSMIPQEPLAGENAIPLLSSVDNALHQATPRSTDVMRVHYTRVQKNSPDFLGLFEGIDQHVNIELSTLVFSAVPKPVIDLYEFIMLTFVPTGTDASDSSPGQPPVGSGESVQKAKGLSVDRIRLRLQLSSVQLILIDNRRIATLSLSTAKVTLLLQSNTLQLTLQLGNLSLIDDSKGTIGFKANNSVLSIEGDNLADLTYETFDLQAHPDKKVNSSVDLRSGSLKFYVLEKPLHDLYQFLVKFARLKSLYDAAREAAVQRASEIQKMQFNVAIQSPILVFPSEITSSQHRLVMRLGKIAAKNDYLEHSSHIGASLTGISLTSENDHNQLPNLLKMLDFVDIYADINQFDNSDPSKPGSWVTVQMSDVDMSLTQNQYCAIMRILEAIPRIIDVGQVPSPDQPKAEPAQYAEKATDIITPTPPDLAPELQYTLSAPSSEETPRALLELLFTLKAVRLHLYSAEAIQESDLRNAGIARFALSETTLRMKTLPRGGTQAEVVLQSFTMTNTCPGSSRFREIIPAQRNRSQPQAMATYTSSGTGSDQSTLIVLTVDSPKVLFALDPVFALLAFFTSAFPSRPSPDPTHGVETTPGNATGDPSALQPKLRFRVDLHDVSLTLLDNDGDPDSRAIALSIKQILTSQEGILALSINQLGMALTTMQSHEHLKFLDELDFTLSLDNRQTAKHQMTSIEVSLQPVIFRASPSDISLILGIISRATSMYSSQSSKAQPQQPSATKSNPRGPSAADRSSRKVPTRSDRGRSSIGQPQVYILKEKLSARFEGLRLVLIGQMYQLPIVDFNIGAFEVTLSDWSRELSGATTIAVNMQYWNFLNSHWEPLIDPWKMSLQIADQSQANLGKVVTLSSMDRLDVNFTSAFVELALSIASTWPSQSERSLQYDRTERAPYRVWNCTGSPIAVWHDRDGNNRETIENAVRLENDKMVDWRFEDSKSLRERIATSRNNMIGIQFQERSWDPLRSISVDTEGESVYVLRPRTGHVSDRLLCEIRVEETVKVVTLRSTYLIENLTLYPLELVVMDIKNKPGYPVQKLAPGKSFAVPIEAVTQYRIKIRPDSGFGYNWCSDAIRWEDMIRMPVSNIVCRSKDDIEPPFRFQASAHFDPHDPSARKYPKITLQLRAPIEIENLLPYDLNYRIFDKNTNQNWSSFLRKGGTMPVHSVQLDHLVLLNVDVQDSGLKPSEFAIINTDNPADFDIEKKLTLSDKSGRGIDLRLNYVKYPNAGGAFKAQIYSPFVLVNRTGLPFSLRSGSSKAVAGLMGTETSQPGPFMFSHAQSRGHEFSLRLGESSWSNVLSFEAPSAETQVILDRPGTKDCYHVGVSWELGLGKYKLIKVVTLAPRCIVKNNLDRAITCREVGVPPTENSTVQPGSRLSMLQLRSRTEELLKVAYPGLNARWTAPINMQVVGAIHLRMYAPGEEEQKPDLVKVDIAVESATIFVTFSLETGRWPFRIENDSDIPFSFCQSDDSLSAASSSRVPRNTVQAHSSIDYAWDSPSAPNKRIRLFAPNGDSREIDIVEIGDLIPFKFRTNRGSFTVSLDVRADMGAQVLSISNYVQEYSLYRPALRRSSSASRSDTLVGTEAFETVIPKDVRINLTINLDFEGLGLSLVNKKLVELMYISCTKMKVEYTDTDAAQSVNLSIGSVQVDNQLHDALYPVILQPTPISRSDRTADIPAIQASLMMLKDDSHGVLFIKYASVLLQAMSISADEDFLFALLDFSKFSSVSWGDSKQDALLRHPDGIPDPTPVAEGQELYFEVLELQPVRLLLSFMRTERINAEDKLVIRSPIAVVINTLTMTLGNVNEAPLELNALGIKDARMTSTILLDRIIFHYRQEVLRQIYRILGSADFLGNPVGLFTNVSSGIVDVFYEPYKGVVMHGNSELGVGIAKGAASLVKKTIFGLSDSVTKVTSSIGKGLSSATFDSEFQRQRRLAQRQNKPKHAIYGVAAGAEALATSFQSGIEGVVMKPIEGAESGGAVGFFKGIGKGLVGAVAKPMVGVFDLASNVSEGIRNTTTVFDAPKRDRVRIPRHVPYDGILQPYSQLEAVGQSWLKDLEGGKFRNEAYVAHLETPGHDVVVILTTSIIIAFGQRKLRLEWEIPFNRLQAITLDDSGIRFSDKAGKEYDQFVPAPKKTKAWFYKEIEKVILRYTTRRRMER
ncbi:vacuolar protein sorting-associated protein 13 [Cantharellus anzutake]|uniref:vacuolar protein sorting-associated protein 13 n=1 Tax=Cantharellus anzutake TaxID=1750568 RepID=UPI00190597B1|nr:vacuolar protein sorting-associated protein 13 [Cantharellus anzutake]KAF8335473.1 vacuolar protein sorting-associated protein 13 [Cantharellus anzutake]